MTLVIKYSVCKFRFVMTRQNILCITKQQFIFFCLFHRLNDFTSNISDFFLPSRERKFGDCVLHCKYQYNHFICLLFIQIRMRFTRQKKMPHILDKARFKQYKYPTSTNTRLANDWWCSWMWGLAAP